MPVAGKGGGERCLGQEVCRWKKRLSYYIHPTGVGVWCVCIGIVKTRDLPKGKLNISEKFPHFCGAFGVVCGG
ncbi:MAG: hypothetical protein ABF946_05390, partial [Acetobacter papayae]